MQICFQEFKNFEKVVNKMEYFSDLILDVGMHNGQDTHYYLSQNYRVVAIDANPQVCARNMLKFKKEIANGQLKIINCAIAEMDNESISFYISKHSSWSSIKKELASRNNNEVELVTIKTKTLKTIIEENGCPYFCKIDIEGYDDVALASLKGLSQLPKYISVESESAVDIRKVTKKESEATLNILIELGYNQFKLIDQASLSVLSSDIAHYNSNISFGLKRYIQKINRAITYLNSPNIYLNKEIFKSTSGLFGELLKGKWCEIPQAFEILNKNRTDLLKTEINKEFSFWCDWHATIK
jgi:FkbM family methyltransferase